MSDFSGSRGLLVAELAEEDMLRLATDVRRLQGTDGEALTYIHPIDVVTATDGTVIVADFGEWSRDNMGGDGAVYLLEPEEAS